MTCLHADAIMRKLLSLRLNTRSRVSASILLRPTLTARVNLYAHGPCTAQKLDLLRRKNANKYTQT